MLRPDCIVDGIVCVRAGYIMGDTVCVFRHGCIVGDICVFLPSYIVGDIVCVYTWLYCG